VARLSASLPRFWPDTDAEPVEINGRPGVLLSRAGATVMLLTVDASDEGIYRLLWIISPDKVEAFERSRSRSGNKP
jgi:RNA polymerase sigma-70 factor (ECF subfamily)